MKNIFTALSDPTRRTIVELLAQHGCLAASDISGRFPVSPPAISQHLKTLREAGLVQVEVRAQQRIYRINPKGINELETWLSQTRRFWMQNLDALERALLEDETGKQ